MYEPQTKFTTTKQILMCSSVCASVQMYSSFVRNSYEETDSELGDIEVVELMDNGIAICTKDSIYLGKKNCENGYNRDKVFFYKEYICNKVPCSKELFKYEHIDISYRYKQFKDPFEYMAAQSPALSETCLIRGRLSTEIENVGK